MKRWGQEYPLMERVRRYVATCKRQGWTPVFTTEQFRAITLESFPDPVGSWGRHMPISTWTIYGVRFTIDDTPRPPMPSATELYEAQWEAWGRRTATESAVMRDLATCDPAWPDWWRKLLPWQRPRTR